MDTALHFGAGNIGRGFIGSLLSLSGRRVLFADVNTGLVDRLHADGQYCLRIVGETVEEQIMSPVDAVLSTSPELPDIALEADLITTAVGPSVLPRIAPAIAACIRRRRECQVERPLQVIACENLFGASRILRAAFMDGMSEEERSWTEQWVGSPNAVVDRIVPPAAADAHPTDAVVEPFYEWVVERRGFVGEVPQIPGMLLADDLTAYVERKLLTLNTGHAVTAYVGQLHGHRTIRGAILDEAVCRIVQGAMTESGEVLIRRHGFDPAAHAAYVQKIILRFSNPWLDDSVQRVGREPMRKLGREDRMMKPLLLAFELGLPHDNLLEGIAAGFRFRCPEDRQAGEIHTMIHSAGMEATIAHVTGLARNHPLVPAIAARIRRQDGLRGGTRGSAGVLDRAEA